MSSDADTCPPQTLNSQLKDIQQQLSVSRLASSAKFTRTIDQGASPGEDSKNGIAQSSPVRLTCSEYAGWHSGKQIINYVGSSLRPQVIPSKRIRPTFAFPVGSQDILRKPRVSAEKAKDHTGSHSGQYVAARDNLFSDSHRGLRSSTALHLSWHPAIRHRRTQGYMV